MCAACRRAIFRRRKFTAKIRWKRRKNLRQSGLKRLHIVDLDGAKNGKVTNLKVLETIAANTKFNN